MHVHTTVYQNCWLDKCQLNSGVHFRKHKTASCMQKAVLHLISLKTGEGKEKVEDVHPERVVIELEHLLLKWSL